MFSEDLRNRGSSLNSEHPGEAKTSASTGISGKRITKAERRPRMRALIAYGVLAVGWSFVVAGAQAADTAKIILIAGPAPAPGTSPAACSRR